MIALVFLIALAALIPFSSGYFETVTLAEKAPVTRQVIAFDNFLAYRGAVVAYAESNPAFNGTIPDATVLSVPGYLPIGFQKTGPWTNTLTATQIVVYSSSDIGSIGASTLSNNSIVDASNYMYGYARSGNWMIGGSVFSSAPAFVPEGAILAIINR